MERWSTLRGWRGPGITDVVEELLHPKQVARACVRDQQVPRMSQELFGARLPLRSKRLRLQQYLLSSDGLVAAVGGVGHRNSNATPQQQSHAPPTTTAVLGFRSRNP